MKINFGCGGNLLDGWENWDSEVDITKPIPIVDGVADEILAEHVCEHISTPDFFRFLLECKRILKRGGKLWLSLPVLDSLNMEHGRDIILGHGHLAAYTLQSLYKILEFTDYSDIEILNPKRPAIFGHWKEIGEEKDNAESARFCLTK